MIPPTWSGLDSGNSEVDQWARWEGKSRDTTADLLSAARRTRNKRRRKKFWLLAAAAVLVVWIFLSVVNSAELAASRERPSTADPGAPSP